ncbi:hypothetical protein FGO68_gene8758 [Halteria grandinella]|uniref:TLDc domain-containing protein n=1 Tax=Halteria grandinella TaxID=5974 RepID=A0A8J8T551_HALGN|nr:hypothetical protein FGO68_gene8758 [Halteria grandinella]
MDVRLLDPQSESYQVHDNRLQAINQLNKENNKLRCCEQQQLEFKEMKLTVMNLQKSNEELYKKNQRLQDKLVNSEAQIAQLISRNNNLQKQYQSLDKRLAFLEGQLISPQKLVKEEVKIEQKPQIQPSSQNLPPLQDIYNSLIIDDEAKVSKIKSFFCQAGLLLEQLQLLYRGSVDTFAASAFHQKCDNKISTLTIVQTTEGKILGGFTPQTWNHQGSKKDPDVWLFNIEAPCIFNFIQSQATSIVANSGYGPIFGSGWDLFISDDCNSNDSNFVKGSSFQYSQGVSNLLLTQGEVHFTVKEIEVYQAFF